MTKIEICQEIGILETNVRVLSYFGLITEFQIEEVEACEDRIKELEEMLSELDSSLPENRLP